MVNTDRVERLLRKLNRGSNPLREQILRVINLELSGSKLTIDYGVKAHSRTEYVVLTRKWETGLWFESILISKEKSGS